MNRATKKFRSRKQLREPVVQQHNTFDARLRLLPSMADGYMSQPWLHLSFRRLFRQAAVLLAATAILAVSPITTYSEEPAVVPPEQFGSVEERRLYDAIQNERASIRDERQELELKKKELKSIEEGVDKKLAQIDQKLEEMKALRQQIEQLLAAKSESELKKTQDLAKIYEKMSPDKAALAISGLNPQLAADLLANMKVKSAARILDQISRQKATDLSTTFSTIQLE